MSVILPKRARGAAAPNGVALDARPLAHEKVDNILLPLPKFRLLVGIGSDFRIVYMRDGGVFGDSGVRAAPRSAN